MGKAIRVPLLVTPRQVEFALGRLAAVPESIELPPITDWAEAHRYVSAGSSPFPGVFRRTTAPHMVEILERMHPSDPCHWVILQKSVQSTGTFHAELAMAYIIAHALGSMGFYTASKELARTRSKANIDVMIDDTTGLAELVKPLSTRNIRKRGDSTFLKEFVGGIKLTIDTYGSISGMKSNTMQYMFLDELDEAPPDLKGQGDTLSILEGRTMAVRNFKVFALSTPTTMESSLIHRLYLEGDQRKYYVPCPLCGEYQELVFMERSRDYGLTYDVDGAGRVVSESVRYVCEHCKGAFGESKKQKMLLAGEWRPTATPKDPGKHSYHITGLLAPEAMLSWERICIKWQATDKGRNVLRYKDFTINIKGEPWAKVKKMAGVEEFKANNLRDYCLGEVPEGGMLLLAGVDVQGDRAECAVVAFGKGFEKWLVDYRVFHGRMMDPNDLAWQTLSDFIYRQTYMIAGRQVYIARCAVDCGWDPRSRREGRDWDDKSHTVYNFVGQRADKMIAVRGSGALQPFDMIKATRTDNRLCPKVYMLNTPLLKEILAREVEFGAGSSAVSFPRWRMVNGEKREIDEEMIRQLLAERYQEIKPGVMGWRKIRPRNEVLDTWLYAVATAYFLGLNTWSPEMWDAYWQQTFKQ